MKPIILSALALATLGASAQDLQTALTQGKASLEVRTRYESTNDSATSPSKSAIGLTNRTVVGYQTGQFYGVSANIQLLDVSTLFNVDNFNNTSVYGKTRYANIAEPHQDRILQGYLEWKGLKVGRQTLSVDNQRFIGAGNWSQAPKSYTGATFKGSFGLPWMEIHAGHITDVVMSDNTHRDLKLEFARIRFQPIQALAITPFYYAADVSTYTTPSISAAGVVSTTTTTPASSYQERGLRADGSWKGLLYEASFAQQRCYKDGTEAKVPNALYRMGMVGYKYQDYSLKVVREALEANFQTPDSSLHGFYGWSDRIGATDATWGLVDTYLQAEAKALGISFEAQYHWFAADKDRSKDYGKELDIQANYPVTKSFSVLAKFAGYVGDKSSPVTSYRNDVHKFWLQTTYKF